MVPPWVIILLLIVVIILIWLCFPRQYLVDDNTTDQVSKPKSVSKVVCDKKEEICIVEQDNNDSTDDMPDVSLLSREVPPSPYFSTSDLKKQVNERIGKLIEDIINKPNPISGKNFVSRGQQICKLTLETIYQKPFITKRCDWLANPLTGKFLELDCYNEELNLAVEYNGKQHYFYDADDKNNFYKSEEDFKKALERDAHKKRMCKENGVYLISVPYTIANRDIPNFIISYLPEAVKEKSKEMTKKLSDLIASKES
jgi:hypothetical protein